MGLNAIPPLLLVVLLGLVVCAALCQTVLVAWRKASRRRAILGRIMRASEGEVRAREFLEQLGFEILGAQVPTTYPVLIDQAEVAISLRADYIVEKSGRRYVVEVKTGKVAPRIDTASTRRQLLEYRVAFDVDGVLLVDAEAAKIQAVTFPLPIPTGPAPGEEGRWGWLLLAFVLILLVIAAQHA